MTVMTVPMIASGGATNDPYCNWTLYSEGQAFECEVVILHEVDGFSSQCTNLPGAFGEGNTEQDALDSISESLRCLLSMYKEDSCIPWSNKAIEGEIVSTKRIIINA
jgi:predicted RNase H-like HicB family nuclease